MKTFLQHVLILGGFGFILSCLADFGGVQFAMYVECGLIVVLFVMLLALCFKKSFAFLNAFQSKFPKTSNYVAALGVAEYFSFFFISIPAFVYGYKASHAAYNGEVWEPDWSGYIEYSFYAYCTVIVLSLAVATYKSFAERKKVSKKKKK